MQYQVGPTDQTPENGQKPFLWVFGIRFCIDLTKLNLGVERELYQLESIEETLAKLGDECVFMSKIDANSGYWQVPLDEASQELTTFITPIGRFCCTRGPYGLSSMQEIFGKKMDVVIEGGGRSSQVHRQLFSLWKNERNFERAHQNTL